MIKRISCHDRAFSLLEMLLALVLLSILSASLYASLSIAYNARSAADRALRVIATLELSLDLMRADIESALPAKGILAGAFIADSEITPGGYDSDYLAFYSTRPALNSSRSGCDIRRVEFLLKYDEENPGELNLVRRTTANLLAAQDPISTEQVLCRSVLSLGMRYYDGLDWLDSWDSATLEGELPFAIEISLILDSPGTANQSKLESEPAKLTRVILLPASPSQSIAPRQMEGFR